MKNVIIVAKVLKILANKFLLDSQIDTKRDKIKERLKKGMVMNFAKRIIPCLDVKNGRVVKGVNFVGLQDAGDPVEIAQKYNAQGADELVFLDITASAEGRGTTIDMVRQVAKEVFIPFSVGGGISSLDDMYSLLNAGCDKISINSAAIKNPVLIEEGAKRFGSQCIVVAVDYKYFGGLDSRVLMTDTELEGRIVDSTKSLTNSSLWHVFINGGRVDTGKDLLEWCKEIYDRGAGEILLTSMDCDGVKKGYDKAGIEAVSAIAPLPLIASGGAGCMQDFVDVFEYGADAALAASVFHYGEIGITQLKSYLKAHNISVRI